MIIIYKSYCQTRRLTALSTVSVIFFITVLCIALPKSAVGQTDTWLFDRYLAGDIDTIASLLDQIPENSGAGQFFRGVFEVDGESARFYYDRIVALYPDSKAEGWALLRLWQYHWSLGNVDQAEKYYHFLETRHPGHPGLDNKPDFSARTGLSELTGENDESQAEKHLRTTRKPPGSGRWRVQMGAFELSEGANDVANKVRRFGEVEMIVKTVKNKKLIVVTVGRFETKKEAKQLARKIKKATGIKGIAVAVDNK